MKTAMSSVTVPEQFRPVPRGPAYPPHQRGPLIEERFHTYYLQHRDRFPPSPAYLPVYWTSFYANCDFARRPLRQLQEFLDTTLERDGTYFTVVQHADGILNHLAPEQVITFAAGGTGDIPIPLLCDPHPAAAAPRDVFASFIGTPTHPCRRRLRALADRDPRFVVRDTDDLARTASDFVDLMQRSVFALCPRGHGRTSFRLYEALQLGAIPVYLFDDLWLPYTDELNWRTLAVLVHVDELAFLPEILDAIPPPTISAMRAAMRDAAARWFTFEACARWILGTVQAIGRGDLQREVVGRSPHEQEFRAAWTAATRRRLRAGDGS